MAKKDQFDFLAYLAAQDVPSSDGSAQNGNDAEPNGKIPSLNELSKVHGVSIAKLREQLGVARALGFVEVRPRTGIKRLPYSFTPAVQESLSYAISVDKRYFEDFSNLRKHIEADYWYEAVALLSENDKAKLYNLVEKAWDKLHAEPIRVPQQEHRDLHLMIYSRLDNPFVNGILEAYWGAYEETGLNLYADLKYLKSVWQFHRQIVDAICEGKLQEGYLCLLEHMDLIDHRTIQK